MTTQALVWWLAVAGVLIAFNNRFWNISYVCPQCGSKNGEHGEDCSFKED